MKYTVILLRPKYLTDQYSIDTYVAQVESNCYVTAIDAAQIEVFKADKRDKMQPKHYMDYKFCLLFEGYHVPKLYGWQL